MKTNNKKILILFFFNYEEQASKYQYTIQIRRTNVNLLFNFGCHGDKYGQRNLNSSKNIIWISGYHFMMR